MLLNLINTVIFCFLILLAFLSMVNPLKVNIRGNLWFGIFLLLWSAFWLDEVLLLTGGIIMDDRMLSVVSFIRFLTPLIFYLSVVFFTNPKYRLDLKSAGYVVIPGLYALTLIYGKSDLPVTAYFLVALILTHGLLYALLSFVLIKKHQKQILSFASSTGEIDLKWLEYIILFVLLIVFVITLSNIFFFGLPLNLYMNGITVVIISFIAYYMLKQKEIFPVPRKSPIRKQEIDEIPEQDLSKRPVVSTEQLMDLKYKLDTMMQEKELFLDSDLNLSALSDVMEVTPHQLSYVINNGFNENFFQYINKYRVSRAKELLTDKESEKLSILGVAFESGFSSKTSFNTTFKKFTGLTPSEFKKTRSGL